MIPFLFGVALSCLLWSLVCLWGKRRRKVAPTLYRRRYRDRDGQICEQIGGGEQIREATDWDVAVRYEFLGMTGSEQE